MKPLVILCFVFAACAYAEDSRPASLAGVYRFDGLTQLIELEVRPSGSYVAHWALDISPENGRAAGSWRLVGDEIYLDPKTEEGSLKGYLRILVVRPMEGKRALLRKEDAKFEKNPFFYFYPKEKTPNQALQHNDPSCHVSCLRTPRASWGRG